MTSYSAEEIGRWVAVAARSVQAADPAALANSMKVLLEDDHWRSYIDPADVQKHEWDDFRLFIRTRLGTTVEQLVAALHHTPRLAAKVLDLGSASKGQPGHQPNSANGTISSRSKAAEMRRLVRDRPELAAQVDAGQLSVHAASVEAGFRTPTATVPIDTPANAIKALSRRFTVQELRDGLDALDVRPPRMHVTAGRR